MKKPLLIIFGVVVGLVTGELLVRLSGTRPAYTEDNTNSLNIEPKIFFIGDSILGWKMIEGNYNFLFNDIFLFSCTNTPEGYRITSMDTPKIDCDTSIYLYGCSYTYGFGVADTASYPYQLQNLYANYEVKNRAVPGYGLCQMFLTLKNDVETGHKPTVAVFNYAHFQNERTPLSRAWSERIKYRFNIGISKGALEDYNYPYIDMDNNELTFKNVKFTQIPGDFPLRTYFAMVNLINNTYTQSHDKKALTIIEGANQLLAKHIYDYCQANGIKLLFVGIDKKSTELVENLSKYTNASTLMFNIDISKPGNNCAPYDSKHPSPKVHSEYAYLVKDYLDKYILSNREMP